MAEAIVDADSFAIYNDSGLAHAEATMSQLVTYLNSNLTLTNALLDGSAHTDTAAATVTRGSLIIGNATPAWDELVIGGVGTFLGSDGTDPSWQSITLSDVSDVTATAAEVNLLDLAGLTTGWVLAADTASTASWQQLNTSDLNNDSGFIAGVIVEDNGSVIGTRPRLNFIEGSDISLTITDDAGNDEVDITIAFTGTASAGGSDTEIQYNNGGSLGGTPELTYDDATGLISYSPTLDEATGNEIGLNITPTINKATSGEYTALLVNVTAKIF
jgi:hypothetical protein